MTSEPARPAQVIAVCGKGGVGKTVFTALLARALMRRRTGSLLLIDADPAGGLTHAIGEPAAITMGDVRTRLIAAARESTSADRQQIADQLDYVVLEALVEREAYALLAMGRTTEKGCYCPVNTLLRGAIDVLASSFAWVLIDAEAGLEQINRQVTRHVDRTIAITDGSARGELTVRKIADLLDDATPLAVRNRLRDEEVPRSIGGVRVLGGIPEDHLLREYDESGRCLWELPLDSPAVAAMERIVELVVDIA